jgi:hypothetical protein
MRHELLTLWFLRLNGYFCVPNTGRDVAESP